MNLDELKHQVALGSRILSLTGLAAGVRAGDRALGRGQPGRDQLSSA